MQTRDSLAATRSICARMRRMVSPAKISVCLPTRARRSRFSDSRRVSLSAFSSVTSSFSVVRGFSRKSSAPSRVARTAISICACPLIITTGAATPAVFRSSSSARPSRRGITTSLKMRSKGCERASSSPRAALSQTVAWWPASRKARDSEANVLASSSTIRMFAAALMLLPWAM